MNYTNKEIAIHVAVASLIAIAAPPIHWFIGNYFGAIITKLFIY